MTHPNVVDVFVSTSQLDQTINDASTKGIKVYPQSGFRFKIGSFEVDRTKEIIDVVRLTVALGNTLNFQSSSMALDHYKFAQNSPTNVALRAGYHSLFVLGDNEYVVFNSAQTKTCQLIRFHSGEDLADLQEEVDICDTCRKAPAVVWCQNFNNNNDTSQQPQQQYHMHNQSMTAHQSTDLVVHKANSSLRVKRRCKCLFSIRHTKESST